MDFNYIDLQQKSLQLKKEILDIESQIINSGNNDIIMQLKEKINIFIDEFMKLYAVSSQEIKQLYNLNDKLLLQFNNLSTQYDLIYTILNNLSTDKNNIIDKEQNKNKENTESNNNENIKQLHSNKLFTEYINILNTNLKQNFDILNKKYEILEANYISLDTEYRKVKQQMNSIMNYINNTTVRTIGEQIINNDQILQKIINQSNIIKQQKNITFEEENEIKEDKSVVDDFQSLAANKQLYPENYKTQNDIKKEKDNDEEEWCSLPVKKNKNKIEEIEVHANEDEYSILEETYIRPLEVIKNRIKLIQAGNETDVKPINIHEFFQYKKDFISSIFNFIPQVDIFNNINRNDNMYKILMKYNPKNTKEIINKCLDLNCVSSAEIKNRYYILLGITL